ncbi:MAG: hypothetical protein Q7S68_02630, partial [Deltaproteobacteria bacterium]|nr:hypothetical protein [Deltaproteobacteria bacterium]
MNWHPPPPWSSANPVGFEASVSLEPAGRFGSPVLGRFGMDEVVPAGASANRRATANLSPSGVPSFSTPAIRISPSGCNFAAIISCLPSPNTNHCVPSVPKERSLANVLKNLFTKIFLLST